MRFFPHQPTIIRGFIPLTPLPGRIHIPGHHENAQTDTQVVGIQPPHKDGYTNKDYPFKQGALKQQKQRFCTPRFPPGVGTNNPAKVIENDRRNVSSTSAGKKLSTTILGREILASQFSVDTMNALTRNPCGFLRRRSEKSIRLSLSRNNLAPDTTQKKVYQTNPDHSFQ